MGIVIQVDFKKYNRENCCDRCGNTLGMSMLSWFTQETLCVECAAKEAHIRKILRRSGVRPEELEGCGYIPDIPA